MIVCRGVTCWGVGWSYPHNKNAWDWIDIDKLSSGMAFSFPSSIKFSVENTQKAKGPLLRLLGKPKQQEKVEFLHNQRLNKKEETFWQKDSK